MNWADYVIIAIVVFSAIVGMVRGFTREAFSLASWIGAFVVAGIFVGRVSLAIEPWVPGEQLRLVLAFVGLFGLTLLVGIIVNHIVSALVERANLGRADRAFGLFFGIVRGYVAVAALVALASFTQLPQKPWWNESKLIPYTLPVAAWIVNHLPRSELEKVKRIKGG